MSKTLNSARMPTLADKIDAEARAREKEEVKKEVKSKKKSK